MSDSMAETLQALQCWGQVTVAHFNDGRWYVTVNMHVNATGVKMEIIEKAESPLISPTVVADNCLRKVRETVESFGRKFNSISA
jgi:regulator of PEP synthase PpsR (kinase-PPPase family)